MKTDNLTKKKVHKNKNNEANKKIINNQDILKNVKKIMKYNDEELNSLNYQNALIYDKRNYCEFYISLLKTKNNLIYSFCYNKDYNSKIVKIDLFFIGFTLFFTINALFLMIAQCIKYMKIKVLLIFYINYLKLFIHLLFLQL